MIFLRKWCHLLQFSNNTLACECRHISDCCLSLPKNKVCKLKPQEPFSWQKLLFCWWPIKFTDRIWHPRTCAMQQEPAIIWNWNLQWAPSKHWRRKIKDKGVWKSTVAIHSLILCATEVDLPVYVESNLAAICPTRCYNCLLCYKTALDRVGEIENEIKQDFINNGLLRVKRLAKVSGQNPEAKKSLKFGKCKQQSITKYHVGSEGWNWCLSFCKSFSASRFHFWCC